MSLHLITRMHFSQLFSRICVQGVFEEYDHAAVVDRRLQDSACDSLLAPAFCL